ncbi:MAG: AAA family ATPase [Coriobacteriaceae bacterium]|nr:AAA family ATPase [Coriobacteriaceae bacterium]
MPEKETTVQAQCITGGSGSGKTQRVVEAVGSALETGVSATDILVLCASPLSCQALRRRLSEFLGAAAAGKVQDIEVTTPREYALRILADTEAIAWSGRQPRILAPFEETFLMEDLKVSTVRSKRLREMLKFFYRSWTELADDEEDWLVTEEERLVHRMLKDALDDTGALLEPEVANLAVGYLRSHEDARQRHGRPYVFIDDYLHLSRASQILGTLLATDSITVAGDRYASTQVFDSYPYADGFDDFAKRYPEHTSIELEDCHRCAPCAYAAEVLQEEIATTSTDIKDANSKGVSRPSDNVPEVPDAPERSCPDLLQAATPEAECTQIADYVAANLDAARPASFVIASPNDTWTRNIAGALDARGIHAGTVLAAAPLKGDTRHLERCVPARIFNDLMLLADPTDALAWRSQIGFGDHIARSAQVSTLREACQQQGISFAEGLEELANAQPAADGKQTTIKTGPLAEEQELTFDMLAAQAGMQYVVDAYRQGHAALRAGADLTGNELLEALTRFVSGDDSATTPEVLKDLCAGPDGFIGDDDDASVLVARVREKLTAPQPDSEAVVLVLPYDQLIGVSPDSLIVAGFVNGFFPCRDFFDGAIMPINRQEQTHAIDVRRAYVLVTKADRMLIFSYFTEADLELAEPLKLKIERVRLRDDDRRICTIEPSVFISQIFGKRVLAS